MENVANEDAKKSCAKYWVLPVFILLIAGAPSIFPASLVTAMARGQAAASEVQVRSEALINFVDVSSEVGVDAVTYCGTREKRHILESGGNGVLLFDYDSDGWLDLYLVNSFSISANNEVTRHPNVLYRNVAHGKFRDVTSEAGVGAREWGAGGCVGDYNNDGHLDLYVTNFGSNILYRNNGDGTFTDVAADAGVGDPRWSTGASFFDYDKDGDLDLYVANYIDCDWKSVMEHHPKFMRAGLVEVLAGPQGYPGARDVFYRNNGDGTFTEVTEHVGLTGQEKLFGFGVITTDYDNDGDSDIYVANDAGRNYLYQNDGQGKFADVSLWNGAGYTEEGMPQAGMGVDAGDYDNDGLMDIIVTNFILEYDTLYRNMGDGLFSDASSEANLVETSTMSLAWGVSFLDYDNDGDLDLFVANGHIYPQVDLYPELGESFRQKNRLYRNEGAAFLDVTSIAGDGLRIEKSSRGAAFGDIDNDGDIDIVISNMDERATVLENRSTGKGNWLMIRLTGGPGDLHGIGARIELTAGELVQVREVRSGSSYLSQNDLRAHFGVGARQRVDKIEILWPDGTRQTLLNVKVNQILEVLKPTGPDGK